MKSIEPNEIRVVFVRVQLSRNRPKPRWIISPHLFKLWERQRSGERVSSSVPLVFDRSGEDAQEWNINTAVTKEALNLPRSEFFLEGIWTFFYRVPSSLGLNWNEDGSFEVEIRFYEAGSQHHPAQERFQSPIGRASSATALYNGTREFGAQLLVLDYFHAQLDCWIGFLKAFLRRIATPLSKDFLWGDLPPDKSPQWGYAYHMLNFRRAVKSLTCAIEMTRRAIRLSTSRLDDAQKVHVEQALLSSEGQCLIANTLIERIQEEFDTKMSIYEDQIKKRQEAAVKLLTWIACIFLPLSTASSLLSMSSRVKDIGSVWWDWLGIVVITGLMVVLGYTWAIKSFALRHSKFFFLLQKAFTDAKRETLKDHEKKHLVHPAVQFLFILSISGFALGAVTAFLIGMFVRLETGAAVLGLSFAGALGLLVVSLLIWRYANLCLWLAQCFRSKSWIWPISLPDKSETPPEGSKTVKPLKKRSFGTSASIILGVVLASGLMVFPVLFTSLFTGSTVFELLYKMILNTRKAGKKMGADKNSKKVQGKKKMIEDMNKQDDDEDVEQEPAASGPED